jgi:hypothetical protein
MSKPKVSLGSAAGLLLVLGTLGACNQTYQSDSAGGPRQNAHEAHSTTARVAKHAERAARDVTASVTAVAKSVEKGVREGVRQGQRDYHSQQAANDRSPTYNDRSPTYNDRSSPDATTSTQRPPAD